MEFFQKLKKNDRKKLKKWKQQINLLTLLAALDLILSILEKSFSSMQRSESESPPGLPDPS